MKRAHRSRLALFLSLVMAAFMACQGMAMASMAGQSLPDHAMPAKMACHEGTAASGHAVPECPSDCQHLVKATDSSGQGLNHLIQAPMMVAFLLPALLDNGFLPVVALSADPPRPDPPPTLRFHRFRE